MIIRPASFRDLSAIEQLYDQAQTDTEGTGTQLHTERPVPQATTLVRLWYAVSKTLSSLVPITDGGDTFHVAEHPQQGIVGFIQAQPAPGRPRSLQIVNLCTASTPAGQLAATQLIAGACRHGQESDINRYYVSLPLGHPLITPFLEQGFMQYASEQILFAELDPNATPESGVALRTAKRDDLGALHLLYLRTTPATVAAIEAPNRKWWEGAYGGGVMGRLGKDDTLHRLGENPGIYAWAGIRAASAARPTVLQLMCEAHHPHEREAFLDALLGEIPPGPVSSVLRHYDSELIRSLQQRGFAIYGTQVLLTKDLTVKVRVPARAKRKKPVLVPAGLAQTVPATQPSPVRLHLIDPTRGAGRSETSPFR